MAGPPSASASGPPADGTHDHPEQAGDGGQAAAARGPSERGQAAAAALLLATTTIETGTGTGGVTTEIAAVVGLAGPAGLAAAVTAATAAINALEKKDRGGPGGAVAGAGPEGGGQTTQQAGRTGAPRVSRRGTFWCVKLNKGGDKVLLLATTRRA